MRPERYGLLVTCEHGGNRVPRPLAHLFAMAGDALGSHRGWDPGALELAQVLARSFGAPLLAAETSRLVVDLNRSRRSRGLFSAYTETLGRDEREALLREHYAPYRQAAEDGVAGLLGSGGIALHISVHTFAPELRGRERNADVGLLYDPSRERERSLALGWQGSIQRRDAALRVRRNYPYRGTADGLTTHLRTRFPPARYLGLELEVNQRHPQAGGAAWPRLRRELCESLAETLGARRVAAAGGLLCGPRTCARG